MPSRNWNGSPPQAGYLSWIDLSHLGIDDDALQADLIGTEKLAITPGTTYGAAGPFGSMSAARAARSNAGRTG